MDIPFFLFEFEDGNVFEIQEDKYEMSFDDSFNVNNIEVYSSNTDIGKFKVGQYFKLYSHTFWVEKAVITNIINFDSNLSEQLDLGSPLYSINIEFKSYFKTSDIGENFIKLYNRRNVIEKILNDDSSKGV